MPDKAKDKLEYEFEDLRRNTDPIPGSVLDAMGMEAEELDLEGEDDPEEEPQVRKRASQEDEGDEGLDEEGKYDSVKMTKRMRKRLSRERRQHQQEITDIKEEGSKRIGALEKTVSELKQGRATDDVDSELETAKAELTQDIEDAMEAGDSKKVAELTTKLADVTTEARLKKHKLEQEAAAEDHDDPDNLGEGKDNSPRMKPKAQAWVAEQEDWWEDPEYADVRNFVVKVDKKLQAAGYSPDDDEFYTELERIVEKRHPEVITATDEMYLDEEDEDSEQDDEIEITPKRGKKRRSKAARHSPVRGANRGGSARTTNKGRKTKEKTLSRTRVANMRMFGMDPDNPEHVEAYMKEI